jgi:hypothetical protein
MLQRRHGIFQMNPVRDPISMPSLSATSAPATCLVALADQVVNGIFSVAEVSTFDIVLEFARLEAASGVGELKRPQKIRRLLEIWSNREDWHKLVHDATTGCGETYSRG